MELLRGPTNQELPEFERLFSTLRFVFYQHPFLIVVVEKLPEQPWPAIVADLPLWLMTSYNDPLVDLDRFARASQKSTVKGKVQYYGTPSEAILLEIFKLVNEKGARFDNMTWNACVFHSFGDQEPEQGWQTRLLARINGFPFHTSGPNGLQGSKATANLHTRDNPDDRQLKSGVCHSGQLSSGPDRSQTRSFRRLKDPQTLRYGDTLFMKTPVNGQREGVHIRIEWSLHPGAASERSATGQSMQGCATELLGKWKRHSL